MRRSAMLGAELVAKTFFELLGHSLNLDPLQAVSFVSFQPVFQDAEHAVFAVRPVADCRTDVGIGCRLRKAEVAAVVFGLVTPFVAREVVERLRRV